jgi:acetyltransferase-like isoleucine patch superfamily enzyme
MIGENLLLNKIKKFILRSGFLYKLRVFKVLRETRNTQTPITFTLWYSQMLRGHCNDVYWPVHRTSYVGNPRNIYCGIETSPGYSPGNYIQAIGKIYIDDYTQIAPNVGIISANHDLYDSRKHILSHVKIGKYCWLGMGSIILPGVELGDFTIVGAGSIVTKSFSEGFCVIAGNPAKLIKLLEKDQCVRHRSDYEYNGYIPSEEFEVFTKKYLDV